MYTMEVFVGIDVGGSHVNMGYIDSTGQLLGSTADVSCIVLHDCYVLY